MDRVNNNLTTKSPQALQSYLNYIDAYLFCIAWNEPEKLDEEIEKFRAWIEQYFDAKLMIRDLKLAQKGSFVHSERAKISLN